jgi:hypothetical protein
MIKVFKLSVINCFKSILERYTDICMVIIKYTCILHFPCGAQKVVQKGYFWKLEMRLQDAEP